MPMLFPIVTITVHIGVQILLPIVILAGIYRVSNVVSYCNNDRNTLKVYCTVFQHALISLEITGIVSF